MEVQVYPAGSGLSENGISGLNSVISADLPASSKERSAPELAPESREQTLLGVSMQMSAKEDPSQTQRSTSVLKASPLSPEGDAIITILEDRSPSYDDKASPSFEKSDAKIPTARTFSIPIGPPPSYNSFSSTITSKLGLRPLRPSKANTKETAWGIHWYMPTCMLLGVLAGLLTAVGHHVYNSRLNGHAVGDPTWPQRYGSAFSFFVKFCLVGTVEIAYKQQAWVRSLQWVEVLLEPS